MKFTENNWFQYRLSSAMYEINFYVKRAYPFQCWQYEFSIKLKMYSEWASAIYQFFFCICRSFDVQRKTFDFPLRWWLCFTDQVCQVVMSPIVCHTNVTYTRLQKKKNYFQYVYVEWINNKLYAYIFMLLEV